MLGHPDAGPSLSGAVTDFDRALDRAVTTHLSDCSDSERRAWLAWYGEYLTRLFAVSGGVSAFGDELDAWTQAWRRSSSQDGQLPPDLRDQLRALLLPRRDPDDPASEVALPIFAARTEPHTVASAKRTIVATMSEAVSLATRTVGEALLLELRKEGERLVELDLDFAMIREARACHERHVGITEYSHSASPRLERFRAALVRPRQGATQAYQAATPDHPLVDLDVD